MALNDPFKKMQNEALDSADDGAAAVGAAGAQINDPSLRSSRTGQANSPMETHTKTSINWGGVVKGVVIVAAVVAAVAVGYVAFQALGTAIATTPALSSAANTVTTNAASATDWITRVASQIHPGEILSGMFSKIGAMWGLTTGPGLATEAVTGTTHVLALAGAGVAGVIAAPSAVAGLHDLHLTTTATVTTPGITPAHADAGLLGSLQTTQSGTLIGAHQLHDLTHITHHAVEHSSPAHHSSAHHASSPDADLRATNALMESAHHAQSWMDRTGAQSMAHGNHANAMRTPINKPTFQPRDPNFASQLETDRVNLETALAK